MTVGWRHQYPGNLQPWRDFDGRDLYCNHSNGVRRVFPLEKNDDNINNVQCFSSIENPSSFNWVREPKLVFRIKLPEFEPQSPIFWHLLNVIALELHLIQKICLQVMLPFPPNVFFIGAVSLLVGIPTTWFTNWSVQDLDIMWRQRTQMIALVGSDICT